MDALESGQDWIILSAGERQAKDFMRKVGQIAEAICGSVEEWSEFENIKYNGDPQVQVEVVRLPNGAVIRGLPANPATARGFSGNVVLDEFAFHERPDQIWRAVFPIISNPLKGRLKLRVLSTPSGKNNKFFGIWDGQGEEWSRHKTTIYDAAAGGLGVDVEELRKALDDPDGWAQEYECQFLEEATQLFPFDLIDACTSSEATMESALPYVEGRLRYGGGDIGRHRDLSCSWVLRTDGSGPERVLVTEEVVVMERMDFASQQNVFGDRIKACSRFAIDATGIGEETAERLTTKYGAGRVEGCKLTGEFKQQLFPGLKDAMQKGLVKIPPSEKLRKSLASIQKQVTQGGTVRYVAAHTADGHADEACALALAVYAARRPTGAMSGEQAKAVKVPRSAFQVPIHRF